MFTHQTQAPDTLVPNNPREATRKAFDIDQPISIADIMKTELWKTLYNEYLEAKQDIELQPLDTKMVKQSAPKFDLRKFWLDFVDQRDRLKDDKYRKSIIDMALNFDVKDAGIPTGNIPIDVSKSKQVPYLPDWYKRALALCLRGEYEYEARLQEVEEKDLAGSFNSQFEKKDNIRQYDKFKGLLAEGDRKSWAMQNCFDRLQVSVYPYGDPPLLTALNDIRTSMFDKNLNPEQKNVKNVEDVTFKNFARAIAIFRAVWPDMSTSQIQGSWIRGCTAIISALDKNILKGTDQMLIKIFIEAKDNKYALYTDINDEPVGHQVPSDWTSRHSWQGNKFHKNAIVSLAKTWNSILSKNKPLARTMPKLDNNPIVALETSDAKFLDLTSI